MKIEKRLLTLDETARYLGLASITIRKGIARKARRPFPVKPVRIGRAVRFDVADLDSYVDNLKAEGTRP